MIQKIVIKIQRLNERQMSKKILNHLHISVLLESFPYIFLFIS